MDWGTLIIGTLLVLGWGGFAATMWVWRDLEGRLDELAHLLSCKRCKCGRPLHDPQEDTCFDCRQSPPQGPRLKVAR